MNLKTRFRSIFIRRFSSPTHLEWLRDRARKRRLKNGTAPRVYYFHQADDPYSHLAVQKLDALKDRYTLAFIPCLVSAPGAEFQGNAAHFRQWAVRDALSVAPDYGVELPVTDASVPTDSSRVARANQALAACLDDPRFAALAIEIGSAFWSDQPIPGDRPSACR